MKILTNSDRMRQRATSTLMLYLKSLFGARSGAPLHRRLVGSLLLVLSLLLLSGHASASGTMVGISDDRSLIGSSTTCLLGECEGESVNEVPTSPFSAFSASGAEGYQNSTFSSTHFGGDGNFRYSDYMGAGYLESISTMSVFDVSFQVTEDVDFELSLGNAVGWFRLDLYEDAILLSSYVAPGNGVLNQSLGSLEAGKVYRALVEPAILPPGDDRWDFDFWVVPEPSTALLMGFGLLGLGARQRFRVSRQPRSS